MNLLMLSLKKGREVRSDIFGVCDIQDDIDIVHYQTVELLSNGKWVLSSKEVQRSFWVVDNPLNEVGVATKSKSHDDLSLEESIIKRLKGLPNAKEILPVRVLD